MVAELVLHTPIFVDASRGAVGLSGMCFKLAPTFSFGPIRSGPDGWTPYAAIAIHGARGGVLEDVEIDCSAVDLSRPELQNLRAVQLRRCFGLQVRDLKVRDLRGGPAIFADSCSGILVERVTTDRCGHLLVVQHHATWDAGYRYTAHPMASSGWLVKDCIHRNGASPLPAGNPYYSVLDRSRSFGGNAMNLEGLIDSTIEHCQLVGETYTLAKLVGCSRVTVRGCVGDHVVVQGCWHWTPEGGPKAPATWPPGVPPISEDVTIEGNILRPDLSLQRFEDHPDFSYSSIVHCNYPQKRTRIVGNHLWPEVDTGASARWRGHCVGLFEGPEVEVRWNTLHRLAGPDEPRTVVLKDSRPDVAKSVVNEDWKTANTFALE